MRDAVCPNGGSISGPNPSWLVGLFDYLTFRCISDATVVFQMPLVLVPSWDGCLLNFWARGFSSFRLGSGMESIMFPV